MEEFAGKTAVITGAGSGMGKAFALRFGAEGMNVVIGDIQQDALDATVTELSASGVPVLGLRTDVSKLSSVEALADAAEERFGPIHLVCALCPGIIATNLFHGSRNRPADLSEPGGMSASGAALRDQMHATLSKGMPPSEVADKLVTAIREDALYLLTDHEWDNRVIARHEAILAGAVGPAATGMLDGVR
jgi:NAD(P)-dependent dehydrogenase (short-subunit alcohol dehydrogenase family)